ncbi:hypothetical protein COBT_002958 [Conglomerata obtusa]
MAIEMTLQIDKYIQTLKYDSCKSITSLIMNIQTIHNYESVFEHTFVKNMDKLFPSFSNEEKNLQNIIMTDKPLWTEKILRLILYYAYDFFHNVHVYVHINDLGNYKLLCLDFNTKFQKIFKLENIGKKIIIFLTIIYEHCIENKLIMRQIIDIKLHDKPISKDLFCLLFKIILLKSCELICDPKGCEYLQINAQNNTINKPGNKAIENTLKDFPNFRVRWINFLKYVCIDEYEYVNVMKITHLISVFDNIFKTLRKVIKSNLMMLILFDIDILKNIIDYVIWSTDMFNTIQTKKIDFLELELFAFFYGVSDEIETLAIVISKIESKIFELVIKQGKANAERYFNFATLEIKTDVNINEKCEQIFSNYLKIFEQEYAFQNEFKKIVTKFYIECTKTLQNILNSINETVCGHFEISRNDYTNESNKLSQNVLSEILNKKIALKITNKTLEDYKNNIVLEQKDWYKQLNLIPKEDSLLRKIINYEKFLYLSNVNDHKGVENNGFKAKIDMLNLSKRNTMLNRIKNNIHNKNTHPNQTIRSNSKNCTSEIQKKNKRKGKGKISANKRH